ncbi:hypothetical protein [Thermanaeromonas toyohensis]|uniref:hypothetical protein n=1 Tax=Thermanaeromonas toyohensis TaxID=161154 RepID=UPI003BF4C9AA
MDRTRQQQELLKALVQQAMQPATLLIFSLRVGNTYSGQRATPKWAKNCPI